MSFKLIRREWRRVTLISAQSPIAIPARVQGPVPAQRSNRTRTPRSGTRTRTRPPSVVAPRLLGDGVGSGYQLGQHGNDSLQPPFSSIVCLLIDAIGRGQHILDRSTFQCGSSCDVEEAIAVSQASFSVALGNVERDRLGGCETIGRGRDDAAPKDPSRSGTNPRRTRSRDGIRRVCRGRKRCQSW